MKMKEIEIDGKEWFELREKAQTVIDMFDEGERKHWKVGVDDVQRAINQLEEAVGATAEITGALYEFETLAKLARGAQLVMERVDRFDEDWDRAQTIQLSSQTFKNGIAMISAALAAMEDDPFFTYDEFPVLVTRDNFEAFNENWKTEQHKYFAARKEADELRAMLAEWKDQISSLTPNITEWYQFMDRVNIALERPFMRLLDADEWGLLPGEDDPGGQWWNDDGEITAINVTKVWSVDPASWERMKNNGMAVMRDQWNGLNIVSNG